MTAHAPVPTADRAETLARALTTCPDLGCDEAIVAHLHWLGIPWSTVSDIADAMIDEMRASRNIQ